MSGKIVLPVKGDTVTTVDGSEFTVVDVARHKQEPAVFVRTDDQVLPLYFKDIEQINGVMVDFKKIDGVFEAIGKLKRRHHLPQPGETVITTDGKEFQVSRVRYHVKSIGLSKGVLLLNSDNDYITLNDVANLKAEGETVLFNRDSFLKFYRGYLAS